MHHDVKSKNCHVHINEVLSTVGVHILKFITLRSVLGQSQLDEILTEHEKINLKFQQITDSQTNLWGIKVSTVEVKHVDLPIEIQRAMAKQA